MFDSIAPDYDKLNHLLSLDVDKSWRRRALKHIVDPNRPQSILDIACGTGDFSMDISRHAHHDTVVRGVDLSEGMLAVMEKKVREAGMEGRIVMEQGNCEQMRYPDDSFDSISIGFGIRNFENRRKALAEILRVLKPGGKLVILELSIPEVPIVRGLYKFYFKRVLPIVGGMVSGERSAYEYLPASVIAFPKKDEWMDTMRNCGYRNVSHKAFSFGICRLYIGEK